MVPYSGLANPVSICLLDRVPLRGIVAIGSFMIPPPFSARGMPAADPTAAKESAANQKIAMIIDVERDCGIQELGPPQAICIGRFKHVEPQQ